MASTSAFDNKIAIVTGAASGIGRALCEEMGRRGAVIVATDIKRVLAYSTISQLGYMMLAIGVGGWVAGLFHLITHAFFKSLMFLASGSVIFGCHHEQEMPKMGGLRRKMPITAYTMLVGVIAIAGLASGQLGVDGRSLGVRTRGHDGAWFRG